MQVRRPSASVLALVAAAVLWVPLAWPSYTANHFSTVDWVKIYNNETIYFSLNTNSTTSCALDYFVLSPDLTAEQRQRYYALLLTAKASGLPVNVGYGEQASDCYNDRVLVYAISLHG